MSVDIDKILKKAKELNAKKKNKPQCNSVITGLPAEYKPWYQGDNFSPEEAEKLETSQPPIMEVLVAAAVEEKNSHQNLHFKEDNFMNHDNDIKMDEIQPNTNWIQSGSKLDPEVDPKWIQSRSKVDPQNLQKIETGSKVDPKVDPRLDPKWIQSRSKVDPNLPTYTSLVGVQKSIVFLIFSECQKARSKVTNPLTIEHMLNIIKCKKPSIKGGIQRLEHKGFIKRISFKNGRGGWSRYTMPDLLFHELLQYESGVKLDPNWIQSGSKVDPKVDPQVDPSLSSSSSYINNKNTTTNGNELPEEWRNINLDLLQDIGFSENHLRQLFNFNTPELVEESIKHFAFGLLNNPKTKQYPNPINVLMGVLRKGQAWVENNYKSLQEIAQEELVARKKAEAERLVKLEQEIYNAEFKIWESGLSATELKAIEFGTQYLGPLKARLKACFDKTIWPTKQNKP